MSSHVSEYRILSNEAKETVLDYIRDAMDTRVPKHRGLLQWVKGTILDHAQHVHTCVSEYRVLSNWEVLACNFPSASSSPSFMFSMTASGYPHAASVPSCEASKSREGRAHHSKSQSCLGQL